MSLFTFNVKMSSNSNKTAATPASALISSAAPFIDELTVASFPFWPNSVDFKDSLQQFFLLLSQLKGLEWLPQYRDWLETIQTEAFQG